MDECLFFSGSHDDLNICRWYDTFLTIESDFQPSRGLAVLEVHEVALLEAELGSVRSGGVIKEGDGTLVGQGLDKGLGLLGGRLLLGRRRRKGFGELRDGVGRRRVGRRDGESDGGVDRERDGGRGRGS